MFHKGDAVLYGSQGVCRVADIAEIDFSGQLTEYYVLKPVYRESSTIYVPVHHPLQTGKMRRVLSADEIYQMIKEMPNEASAWIENENERKAAYKEILLRGDRGELIRVIKALYLHQQERQAQGKKMHVSDERFFKEAEKLLYDEFAMVLEIKPEEVLPFILEQLRAEEAQPEQEPPEKQQAEEQTTTTDRNS